MPRAFAGVLLCDDDDENRFGDFNSWQFISKPGPARQRDRVLENRTNLGQGYLTLPQVL